MGPAVLPAVTLRRCQLTRPSLLPVPALSPSSGAWRGRRPSLVLLWSGGPRPYAETGTAFSWRGWDGTARSVTEVRAVPWPLVDPRAVEAPAGQVQRSQTLTRARGASQRDSPGSGCCPQARGSMTQTWPGQGAPQAQGSRPVPAGPRPGPLETGRHQCPQTAGPPASVFSPLYFTNTVSTFRNPNEH